MSSKPSDTAALPALWEPNNPSALRQELEEALTAAHETCLHDVAVDLSKLSFRISHRLRLVRGLPSVGTRRTQGRGNPREFIKDTRESLAIIAARIVMFEEQLEDE